MERGVHGVEGGARGAVRVWLMILFALVVVMIAVGGLTRLTDSGLSITEWKPVTGALPPMSAADWEAEFALYKQIPEYQLQNRGMSLEEFKVIYWWEWGHRQLGRVIGLVWALGFFFFLFTKRIPTGWTGRLLLLGALGGLQGAIGWWMVSSGLTGTMLDVASYRLATHLGLAFVIMACAGISAAQTEPAPQKSLAATMNVYVFPTTGQTAQQQSTDEAACYDWAVQNTGGDPFALQKQAQQSQQQADQAQQQIAQAEQRLHDRPAGRRHPAAERTEQLIGVVRRRHVMLVCSAHVRRITGARGQNRVR